MPAGKIVGLNPSVMTRDLNVCSPDGDLFRPERWFRLYGEDGGVYAERLRKIDKLNTLVWGGGNRSYLRRFLVTMSLYKVTAMLFSRYDIMLGDPTKEWILRRHLKVCNGKINLKITQRNLSIRE